MFVTYFLFPLENQVKANYHLHQIKSLYFTNFLDFLAPSPGEPTFWLIPPSPTIYLLPLLHCCTSDCFTEYKNLYLSNKENQVFNGLDIGQNKCTSCWKTEGCISQNRVKIMIAWLLALPTFSFSPTKATRDIVMEGDELNVLEEVKTIRKTILELGWVMPHSGLAT